MKTEEMIERLAFNVTAKMPRDRNDNVTLDAIGFFQLLDKKVKGKMKIDRGGMYAILDSPAPMITHIEVRFGSKSGSMPYADHYDAIHVWAVSPSGQKSHLFEAALPQGHYNSRMRDWWLGSMNPSREDPAKMEKLINDLIADTSQYLNQYLKRLEDMKPKGPSLDAALQVNTAYDLGIDPRALRKLFELMEG